MGHTEKAANGPDLNSGEEASGYVLPETTDSIRIPSALVEQVIGQEEAVEILRRAARQRRHLFLIGEPGTGKSMLGKALSDLLSREPLVDVLAEQNPYDPFQPLVRVVPAGEGRRHTGRFQARGGGDPVSDFPWGPDPGIRRRRKAARWFFLGFAFLLAALAPWWAFARWNASYSPTVGAIMFLSFAVSGVAGFGLLTFLLAQGRPGGGHRTDLSQPALIVDNGGWEGAPFWDGSGAHAGALLGDVLHDPYQSGGLGTPPHIRVVAGLIHKAHLGVLYVDEIGTLERHTQQQLLTAIQDGEFAITGQSETSAGAMVRTAPVPCRFLLVAAGNKETVAGLHPALRSRIRGYGYEVLLRETMPDSPANRYKLAIFVAQEVGKDGRIPPFHRSGLEEIIGEARRMAGSQGGLTLRLRDLGGLVRAAGDLAAEEGSPLVESRHVLKALAAIRSMERRLSESKTTNQGS